MIGFLYRCVLGLHPPGFRRQFAEEMRWIFDEAAAAEGAASLLWDGVISLARQWVLRSGSWKFGAAVAAAIVQVIVLGTGMLALGYSRSAYLPQTRIGMLGLLQLTAWLVAGILLTILLTVLWFRKVSLCSNSGTSRSATRALRPSKT
jgi:hypothetical protein